MSINQNTVTVTGNIGNDPTRSRTTSGTPVLNFRVGVSSGYFDRRTGAWVDGDTSWYAVAAYGNLAEHAHGSLRRGDPIVIIGRLKIREWEANGKKGVSADIVADTIGHDLNRGTSAFVRRARPGGATAPSQVEDTAGDEVPEDHRTAWDAAGLHDPEVPAADDEFETTANREEFADA
ncbi:single-stranded DNA-binding protein [Microbacterium sp. YJN-G]|uniref:single-stranded DNA-binding protein n=1 Tax=Microbacterium sp. YJN-G TaxID=2763257 RepID=UPI001877D13D|nr:single-stranded DNA-binding protein [Microbacterium sp. YJN-G]